MNQALRMSASFLFSLIIGIMVIASPVRAGISDAVLGPTTETNTLLQNISGNVGTIKKPGEVVARIIQIVLGILGLVAVAMMMYAGFLWLTAGGEEEKAKQGRTLLFQALIGLIIILSAYMVTYFVLRELTKAIAGP